MPTKKWILLFDAAEKLKSLESGSLEEAAQRLIKAIADRELDAICHEILNDVQEGQSFNISHSIDPSWLSCAAYVDAEGSLVRFDIKAVARARLNGARMMDPPKYARAFSVDAARFTELWPATEPASPSATANEDMRQAFVDWMKSEKVRLGTYPPRDIPAHSSPRPNWRQWAAKHDVPRETARRWVSDEGLSEGRGAPKQKTAVNNLAGQIGELGTGS